MGIALLDRLLARHRDGEQQTANRWTQLVADITAGKAFDDDKVFAKLNELGKTVDDLEQAVSLRRRRLDAVATIQAAASAQAELDRLSDERDEAHARYQAELAEIQTRFAAVDREYTIRREANLQALSRASNARHELLASCDPLLKDRERQLLKRRQETTEALVVAEQTLKRVMADPTARNTPEAEQRQRELLREAESYHQRLTEQLQTIDSRLDACREQMLHP